MNRLKRWTSGILSSFDGVLTQIENHESLINSAIREVADAGARAKAQLERVKRDGLQMRKKLQGLREQEILWRERAVNMAPEDEAKALDCVRRMKALTRQIAALEEEERNHAKLEKQLGKDLENIGERIDRLKEQRNLMVARQFRAEALKEVQGEGTHLISDIEEIFDRWESKITQYEFHGNCSLEVADDLNEGFFLEEETVELKASLEKLLESRKE